MREIKINLFPIWVMSFSKGVTLFITPNTGKILSVQVRICL
jgi:hypothetical protein